MAQWLRGQRDLNAGQGVRGGGCGDVLGGLIHLSTKSSKLFVVSGVVGFTCGVCLFDIDPPRRGKNGQCTVICTWPDTALRDLL